MKRALLIGALMMASPAMAQSGSCIIGSGMVCDSEHSYFVMPTVVPPSEIKVSPKAPVNCTITLNYQGGVAVEGCDLGVSEPGTIRAKDRAGSVVIRRAN